ncbi:MAG: c-type cytochrome [Polynucleobacter victoriensis]
MFKLANQLTKHLVLAGLALGAMAAAHADTKYPNIGREATKAEVAAWDIDVRPDFKGLPKGSGTTARGQEVWEGRCASCHVTFGESNEVFTPIVGGTTKEDIKTGRVASLTSEKQPQRTTLMKVATVSTLWDYIHRAMPWNAPRTLSVDDTYAVLGYVLSMAEIVPEDFTLSDQNIAEVQKLMPNRNGMTQAHGMWNEGGKPDVKATACMSDCSKHVTIGSTLPDYARNAHENLALQNRPYGPFRGADTTKPPLAKLPGKGLMAVNLTAAESITPEGLFKKHNCSTCHAPASRAIGPAISEVAAKYKGQADAMSKLHKKVKVGGAGTWGAIPMPPHAHVPEGDIEVLVRGLLTGK